MILLDTNIFLELLLDQKRANQCERLLEHVAAGKIEAVVTRFSVHAVEAILGKSEHVARFLRNVDASVGLLVYDTSNSDEMAATILQENTKLDFDDALQYYVAKKLGLNAIVSFDGDFDGLDVDRIEPEALPGMGKERETTG